MNGVQQHIESAPERILGRHVGVRTTPTERTPHNQIPDGNLLGNGDLGVAVGGGAAEQVFFIDKNDFWTDNPKPYNGRRAVGKYDGYSKVPIGRLSVCIPSLADGDFRQEMDLFEAVSRSVHTKDGAEIRITARVPATGDLLLINLESSVRAGADAPEVEVAVWAGTMNWSFPGMEPADEGMPLPTAAGMDDAEKLFWVTRDTITCEGVRWVAKAAVAARIMGCDYRLTTDARHESKAVFKLEPGRKVTIAACVKTLTTFGKDIEWTHLTYARLDKIERLLDCTDPRQLWRSDESPLPAARERAAALTLEGAARLVREHRDWWRAFWSKAWIELPDEPILEQFWYGGLYVMAASNREGKIAAPLFGNWNTCDLMRWGGDYTWNYNHEHARHQMYACNHPELARPYFDSVLSNVPLARKTARDRNYIGVGMHYDTGYGPYQSRPPNYDREGLPISAFYGKQEYDGLYFDCHSGPYGVRWSVAFCFGDRYHAVEAALPFIQYYLYTKDRDFLEQIAYPYMRETMVFWGQYLTPEDLTWRLPVSREPEAPALTGVCDVTVALRLANRSACQKARIRLIRKDDVFFSSFSEAELDLVAWDDACTEYRADMGTLCLDDLHAIEFVVPDADRRGGACLIHGVTLHERTGREIRDWSFDPAHEHRIGYRYVMHSGSGEGFRGEGYMNPSKGLAALRAFLKELIAFSETLGRDPEHRDTWRDMLRHLSPYPTVVHEGKLMLAIDEAVGCPSKDNIFVSQFPVFPAEDVDTYSPWRQAALNSLNANPRCWDQVNSFSSYAAAVRIGYPLERVQAHLKRRISESLSPGGVVLIPEHASIENAAAIEAVTSMLLQSHEGFIRLFPAWDRGKDAQFHNLRAKGAFLVSARLAAGEVSGVEVVSEKGGAVTVFNPWPGRDLLVEVNGKAKAVVSNAGWCTFDTQAGECALLSPGGNRAYSGSVSGGH